MANIDVNGTGNANLIFGRGAGNANLSFGGSGSGGGTSDYTLLRNKPSINGVTLIGDKTSSELYIHDLVTVDYGTAVYSVIDVAVDKQRDVVCIYHASINELYYLPLTHFDTPTRTFTFSGVYDGKIVSASVNQSNTWVTKTETVKDTVFVHYNITSYDAVEAAVYANKNVVCVKDADIGNYYCDLLAIAKDENDINIYVFSCFNLQNNSIVVCVLTRSGWNLDTYPLLTPSSAEALPPGGNIGQVLAKVSNTSYDVEWVTPSGGDDAVTDVTVNGTSVVSNGVAAIDISGKADSSSLASVATSGSYADLSNKPRTVFYAEYGVTTYAQVAAAVAADMYVVCVFSFLSGSYTGGPFYTPLLYDNDQHNIFHFYTMFGKNGYTITLDSTDGWSQIMQDSFEQVHSDWNVTDGDSPAYISNKPTIPSKTSDLTNDSGFITPASVPTKTSDLTNDSGFITSADVPQEIFRATYGTTTTGEIVQALTANKQVFAVYGNKVYMLSKINSSASQEFVCVDNGIEYRIVCNNNVWSNSQNEIGDIFWAEYGETTCAEIEAARTAGKLVCVAQNYWTYQLTHATSYLNYYRFTCFNNGVETALTCDNDVWDTLNDTSYVRNSAVGVATGICPLDANGKVSASYLPIYNGGVTP